MASNELQRILRGEWSSIGAFAAAVHEHTDIYTCTMSRKEVISAVCEAGYTEHHPLDNGLIRILVPAGEFWEQLAFSEAKQWVNLACA